MPTLDVTLAHTSYRIHVGAGALADLGTITADVAPSARAFVVVDRNVEATHGAAAVTALRAASIEPTVAVIDAMESAKSLETVRTLYDAMLAERFERRTPVIAVGGGITGDVAGFVAATYLRGVPVIQVPTTLLAMVDASIGGKTGVNVELPGRGVLGKNLIGAFWQPAAILADPATLATLDDRQLRNGLAESIKHAVIADAALLTELQRGSAAYLARDADALTALIHRSASIKVAVVEADEREAGGRAALNLGHTFAHAIEPRPELGLHHGEAVAIGMCAAAAVARATGRLAADDHDAIVGAITAAGLPTELSTPVPASELIDAMGYDKKVDGGAIRLVLPTALGAVVIGQEVPRDVLEAGWRAVGSTSA